MARAGDQLVGRVTGLATVFRATAAETGGELLRDDRIAEPGWTTRPDHVHPRQDERFEVLSGTLGVRVDRVEHVHSAGEVHVLVDFRHPLRTEAAFETLARLARDGKTTAAGVPKDPLRLALIARHFEEEIHFVRPPLAVRRVVLGALAAIARLLGDRAEYPYPELRRRGPAVGSRAAG